MKLMVGLGLAMFLTAGLFLFIEPKEITIGHTPVTDIGGMASGTLEKEAGQNQPSPTSGNVGSVTSLDSPNGQALANPPTVIKAVYLTGWSAGLKDRIDYVKKIAQETEINAVVIDIKDYSGELSYVATIPETVESGAGLNPKINRLNTLLGELHAANIYVIGRVAVFQDPVLAKAHPEWALKQGSSTVVWKDQKGLAWMDAAAQPVWDYNIAIAKDILSRGFDEVNFDYVRFPTDGSLSKIGYPYWDKKTPRHQIIGKFFKYVRSQLPEARLSVDLFGLTTINNDDLGIGQVIEDAYRQFDYVAPMVYPSHYASGFLGHKNPADYPYEVVKYSMDNAVQKLENLERSSTVTTASGTPVIAPLTRPLAKLRPWFQDFNLGATYDTSMVRKQIAALKDAASSTPSLVDGWMIWNPSNRYTVGAFLKENE